MPQEPKPIHLSEVDKLRFWEKVNKCDPNECWEWQAALNSNGYGHFQLGTLSKPRVVRANRVAFVIAYGNTELNILHSCNNPACCNPLHLYAGTQNDNMKQSVKEGRSSRGEKCNTAKLTEADIMSIRNLYSKGWLQREIAVKYKISQSQVSHICTHSNWKHI